MRKSIDDLMEKLVEKVINKIDLDTLSDYVVEEISTRKKSMSPKLYYFGIIYKSSKGIETWYIGANHTHKFQDKEKADKWTKQACLEYISKYNIYNNIYILESVE